MNSLGFKRLSEKAILPTRAHPTDAGLDLYSTDMVTVSTGNTTVVSTGWAVEIPEGYVGLVHPRSGLAFKHGITVVNSPGTIDSEYRGEIKVALTKVTGTIADHWYVLSDTVILEAGERIAQLVIQKVELPIPAEIDELSDTTRGTGGFGSTGR